MKLQWLVPAVLVSFQPQFSQGVETAHATAFCYSLKFQRGFEPNGFYYLDVSSVPGSINGELALDFLASGYTHSTYLTLADGLVGENLSGAMALDVPNGGDGNHDGFADFFETSQGITNVASSGAYNLDLYGNGSATASWNRAAGSKDGSCALTVQLMVMQPVTFTIPFQILEYTGSLSYSPSTSNVTGSLRLVQSGNPAGTMNGAVTFVKSPTDRFNELTLQPGVWTNELQQPLSYSSNATSRDLRWPTNYYGHLEFDDDANSSTFYPFAFWELSIDDLNDWNHNGIPDFSDDPGVAPLPRQPLLELLSSSTNLVLVLHGDVGRVHEIQMVGDLSLTNWQTQVSVTLTNDPQPVSVALPAGAAFFWRAKAQ